jgi:hypothetical protein
MEYQSPVGDTYGEHRVFLYNPQPTALTVFYDSLDPFTGAIITRSKVVSAGKWGWTEWIPDGTGVVVRANQTFMPLSIFDSDYQLNQTLSGLFTSRGEFHGTGRIFLTRTGKKIHWLITLARARFSLSRLSYIACRGSVAPANDYYTLSCWW